LIVGRVAAQDAEQIGETFWSRETRDRVSQQQVSMI